MSDAPPTPLDTLQAALEEALGCARELASDRLLARMLAAFRTMPAEDRPAIIEALEREVTARKLSLAAQEMSGQSMVPNAHARLYLRAHESSFDRSVLERDEMMIATVRGMRAATLIPAVPEIHASWRDATREAMLHVDDATRTVVEGLVREVLRFIADAREADCAAVAPPPAPSGTDERAARES
jgi:hypothetical protein